MQSISAELTPPHTEGTRSFRPSFISDVVIGSGVLAGSLEGTGKSPIPGFYSLLFTVALVALILQGVRDSRLKPVPDASAESPRTATLYASAWAIGIGVILWAVIYFGWRDATFWQGCAVIALFSGVRRYWFGRKLPHPQRVTFILAAILFFALVIVPAIVRWIP